MKWIFQSVNVHQMAVLSSEYVPNTQKISAHLMVKYEEASTTWTHEARGSSLSTKQIRLIISRPEETLKEAKTSAISRGKKMGRFHLSDA